MLIMKKNTQTRTWGAVVAIATIVASLGLSVRAHCASYYPQYRGNAQRTGFSNCFATYDPSLLWTWAAGPSIGASAVIGEGGTAYCGGRDNAFYAISANGSTKWRYATDSNTVSSAAVGSDGSIYFINSYGKLYAININGTSKWASPFNSGVAPAGSLLIANDGTIYFGAANKRVYAVNPDGTLKWSCATGGAIKQSLTMSADGSTIYACAGDGRIYAIGTNGTIKWNSTVISPTGNCAVSNNGKIYVGGMYENYGVFYALDQSGNVSWTYNSWSTVTAAPAIGIDGTIYFGCEDNRIYAVGSDGKLKWSYISNGPVYSAPIVDGSGTVIFGSSAGKLTALNASSGSLLWSRMAGSHIYESPLIGDDGSIYVTNSDGRIYKFSGPVTSSPEPSSLLALGSLAAAAFGMNLKRFRRQKEK